MKRQLLIAIGIVTLVFLGTGAAQVDLSAGVARVSLINGDVSSQRGDTGDWAASALNQPVVAGDSISTGDRSKAEIQLDHANILRLGNNSQARVATLTRTQVQVQVSRGLAYYSVFKDSDAEIEIDTPNVSIRPTSKEGVYRIEVNGGDTQVAVRKGSADISTPQGSTRLEKGQAAIVRGTADEAEYKLMSAPSKDSWDSWNNERDGAIRNAQSWGHTNRYYVGSEDLDAYGHWVNVPDYGQVWAPVVSAGWAPYRAGRWVWEPYWGWTWVSYEPWGWAPYHYGRWFYWNSSWMWWPGPVYPHYRPIWAPAYVSFFGFGNHWGVGFGFGSIGWMPIGPCDYFYPWWGRHRSRFNVVNVTNITNITNIKNVQNGGVAPLHRGNKFSNLRQASTDMRVREAISTVPTEHFATGRAAAKPVSHEAFREGKLMAGNIPLVPTKDNLSATNRPASATTFAAGSGPKRFFTHKEPAAPQSFEHQAEQVQRAIDRNPKVASGAHVTEQADAQGSSKASVSGGKREARSESPASQPGGKDGWQRFDKKDNAQNPSARTPDRGYGETGSSAAAGKRTEAPRQEQPANQERYGWHKFSRADGAQNESRASGQANRVESRQAAPANAPAKSETPRERGDGWQKFTPQSKAADTPRSDRSGASERWTPATNSDEGRGAGYSRDSRASDDRERDSGPSYRPPLNLHQPIVTPRSGGSSASASGGSRGGGGGSHSSGGGGGAKSGGSSGGGSKGSSGGGQSHGNKFR